MNFYPIWPVIYARSNSTGRISNSTGHEILVKLGWNSLYASLVELGIIPMKSTGIYLNGFTPILSSISCPVEFDRAWNTAQIGLKFMDLHPIWAVFQARSNWVSSQWIYSHFEQYFMPGQIRLVKLGIIPMNSTGIYLNGFTPILSSISCPVEFDRSNWVSSQWIQLASISMDLLPFWAVFHARSNSTGRIGYHPNEFNWHLSQWIYSHFEQYFMPGRIQPVELGIIPMNSTGIYLNGFTPILSSISCPVEFNRSNWVSSQWIQLASISMDLLPFWAVFQAWSNWVSSQWIYSHFEQYFRPGRIRPGMKYCSIWVEIHGFTPNLSSISGLVELAYLESKVPHLKFRVMRHRVYLQ